MFSYVNARKDYLLSHPEISLLPPTLYGVNVSNNSDYSFAVDLILPDIDIFYLSDDILLNTLICICHPVKN